METLDPEKEAACAGVGSGIPEQDIDEYDRPKLRLKDDRLQISQLELAMDDMSIPLESLAARFNVLL